MPTAELVSIRPQEQEHTPEVPSDHQELVGFQVRALLGRDALNPNTSIETIHSQDLGTFSERDYSVFQQASERERHAFWNETSHTTHKAQRDTWALSFQETFTASKPFFQSEKGQQWVKTLTQFGITSDSPNAEEAHHVYDLYFSPDPNNPAIKKFVKRVIDTYTENNVLNYDRLRTDLPAIEWFSNIFGHTSSEVIGQMIDAEAQVITSPHALIDKATLKDHDDKPSRVNKLQEREIKLLRFLTGTTITASDSADDQATEDAGTTRLTEEEAKDSATRDEDTNGTRANGSGTVSEETAEEESLDKPNTGRQPDDDTVIEISETPRPTEMELLPYADALAGFYIALDISDKHYKDILAVGIQYLTPDTSIEQQREILKTLLDTSLDMQSHFSSENSEEAEKAHKMQQVIQDLLNTYLAEPGTAGEDNFSEQPTDKLPMAPSETGKITTEPEEPPVETSLLPYAERLADVYLSLGLQDKVYKDIFTIGIQQLTPDATIQQQKNMLTILRDIAREMDYHYTNEYRSQSQSHQAHKLEYAIRKALTNIEYPNHEGPILQAPDEVDVRETNKMMSALRQSLPPQNNRRGAKRKASGFDQEFQKRMDGSEDIKEQDLTRSLEAQQIKDILDSNWMPQSVESKLLSPVLDSLHAGTTAEEQLLRYRVIQVVLSGIEKEVNESTLPIKNHQLEEVHRMQKIATDMVQALNQHSEEKEEVRTPEPELLSSGKSIQAILDTFKDSDDAFYRSRIQKIAHHLNETIADNPNLQAFFLGEMYDLTEQMEGFFDSRHKKTPAFSELQINKARELRTAIERAQEQLREEEGHTQEATEAETISASSLDEHQQDTQEAAQQDEEEQHAVEIEQGERPATPPPLPDDQPPVSPGTADLPLDDQVQATLAAVREAEGQQGPTRRQKGKGGSFTRKGKSLIKSRDSKWQ